MGDRVDGTDMPEELIAEPLPFRRAAHEAGDIDELDRGGNLLPRIERLREPVETVVRDADHAGVRLDRAERIVLGGDSGRRYGIEQRRLTDVRQADDSTGKTHM